MRTALHRNVVGYTVPMDKNSRDYIVLAQNADMAQSGDPNYFSAVAREVSARNAAAAIGKVRRQRPELGTQQLAAIAEVNFHVG